MSTNHVPKSTEQLPLPGIEPPGKAIVVTAPRDFLISPIFCAVPVKNPKEPRKVEVEGRIYQIGVPDPLDPTFPTPILDVRHARVLFTLLSFGRPKNPEDLIPFSINEFCLRYANSNGGRYSRDIKKLLSALTHTYIRIEYPEENRAIIMRLIEHLVFEERGIRRKDSKAAKSPQMELWLNGARLSHEFFNLLSRICELAQIRLDVLTGISSHLAQAIYIYVPSRAAHCHAKKPWSIGLEKLLIQVGHPVPAKGWLRAKLFTQNRTPILKQLDGKATLTGFLRVAIVKGKKDHKLIAWVEKPEHQQPTKYINRDTVLYRLWRESGRDDYEYERHLLNQIPLNSEELRYLQKGQINVDGSRVFLEMSKALLGVSEFTMLIAEAKGAAVEKIPATKNPTARLIHRIKEAIRRPVRKSRTRETTAAQVSA